MNHYAIMLQLTIKAQMLLIADVTEALLLCVMFFCVGGQVGFLRECCCVRCCHLRAVPEVCVCVCSNLLVGGQKNKRF